MYCEAVGECLATQDSLPITKQSFTRVPRPKATLIGRRELAETSLLLYREYAKQMRKICDQRRYLRHTRLSVPLRWPADADTRLGQVARNELINSLFEQEERKIGASRTPLFWTSSNVLVFQVLWIR